MMDFYLETNQKQICFGCEACLQVCAKQAISMIEDAEGFRYPKINADVCVNCGLCKKVCPAVSMPTASKDEKLAFGGCHIERTVRERSTSGGAFSAIIDGWCHEEYVIFGAAAKGLKVYHTYIRDKAELSILCKSKYAQSHMGDCFKQAKLFLQQGKQVVFSGTPCQIAGLRNFLKNTNTENLLTIEVICEGIPSAHFMRSYEKALEKRYNAKIRDLDYRYKNMRAHSGKWDFQVMYTVLENDKEFRKDRWFNPFWSIWLKHLMSRPSCYACPFTTTERVADITLGDLWGVHLYCKDLYARNEGASLIVCNTAKGRSALECAMPYLQGRNLEFDTALKYQSPMRKHIEGNPDREQFLQDVKVLEYHELCKKWATKPSLKLLWQKYIWGNRQKVFFWNLKNRIRNKR